MADPQPVNPINPQTVKSYQALGKVLGTTGAQAKTLVNNLNKIYNITNKTKIDKDFFESISQVKKETGSLSDIVLKLNKEVKKLSFEDALKSDKAGKLQKKLKSIYDGIQDIGKEADVDAQKEKFKEFRKEAGKLEDQINNIKDTKINFKMNTGTMTTMFQNISKGPDILNMMGEASKGLGKSLGGVSKMLGGWPMLILSAAKAIYDVTVEADKFVKNANKAFASIRGPDIMTKDVNRQFKEFNDQIYSTAETIRTGLGADAMKGFLEAVSQTGYNITQFQGGLTTYSDAIEVAAKASKILGIDVVQAGQYMGILGKDYRENLGEMGKSFNLLAFDAKKSGLNTSDFWNIVQNATSSLTLYGVKIDEAGKILSTFSHNQVGGAKDAAAAAEGMLGVFTDVDRKQNAIAMSMMEKGVPGVLANTFKELGLTAGGKIGGIKEQIKLVEAKEPNQENLEALDRLHTDLINAERQQQDAIKAEHLAQKGEYVALGTYFGDLGSKASSLVPAMIKGILPTFTNIGKIDENNQTLLENISNLTHLSVPALRGIIKNGQFTNLELKELSEGVGTDGDKLLDADKATKDDMTSAIQEMDDGNGQGFDNLISAFTKIGMDPIKAKELTNLVKNNKAIKDTVKKALVFDKKDGISQIKNLQRLIVSNDVSNQATFESIDSDNDNAKDIGKKADDTFDKIKDLTLSIQEIQDAAENEVKYRAYSMTAFKSMSSGITAIAKLLTSHFHKGTEYKSPEELVDEAKAKIPVAPSLVGGGIAQYSKQASVIADVMNKRANKNKIDASDILGMMTAENPAGDKNHISLDKSGKPAGTGLTQMTAIDVMKELRKEGITEKEFPGPTSSTGGEVSKDDWREWLKDPTNNMMLGAAYLQDQFTNYQDKKKGQIAYTLGSVPAVVPPNIEKYATTARNAANEYKGYGALGFPVTTPEAPTTPSVMGPGPLNNTTFGGTGTNIPTAIPDLPGMPAVGSSQSGNKTVTINIAVADRDAGTKVVNEIRKQNYNSLLGLN
jgi:hypothetical protein